MALKSWKKVWRPQRRGYTRSHLNTEVKSSSDSGCTMVREPMGTQRRCQPTIIIHF